MSRKRLGWIVQLLVYPIISSPTKGRLHVLKLGRARGGGGGGGEGDRGVGEV